MTRDIALFKQKLEEEKTHLEKELGTVAQEKDGNGTWEAKGTLETDDNVDADPNVTADKIEEFETNQAITESFKADLLEINDALGKIEAGTYGLCEVCNKEIEDDRLGAYPSARTCKEHMS
jgi:RNA polymerase-binding transcription factor DksA